MSNNTYYALGYEKDPMRGLPRYGLFYLEGGLLKLLGAGTPEEVGKRLAWKKGNVVYEVPGEFNLEKTVFSVFGMDDVFVKRLEEGFSREVSYQGGSRKRLKFDMQFPKPSS